MWPVAGRQQVLAAPKMSACGRCRGHQADSASAGGVQDMAEIVAGRFWLMRLGASWLWWRLRCGVDEGALLGGAWQVAKPVLSCSDQASQWQSGSSRPPGYRQGGQLQQAGPQTPCPGGLFGGRREAGSGNWRGAGEEHDDGMSRKIRGALPPDRRGRSLGGCGVSNARQDV
jgi:hypothetical protein